MGRPSVLNPRTKSEILRRLAMGEKRSALRKEFKLTETTFRRNFSADVSKVRDVGTALATAEMALASLPISAQVSARTLADQLKGISSNVASAALAGSKTATRLATLANERAEAMGVDLMDLPSIAALGKTANEAAGLAMGLLNANKGNAPTPDELFTPDVAAKMLSLQNGKP